MANLKISFCVVAVLVFFTGCGGGGSADGAGNITSDQTSSQTGENLIIFDKFGGSVAGTFSFGADVQTGTQNYEIKDITANGCLASSLISPVAFSLSSITKTQDISFTTTFSKKCITDKLTVLYERIGNTGLRASYSEIIQNPDYEQKNVKTVADNDPLYGYQWHLKNTGQKTAVSTAALSGEDINVERAWLNGVSGKNVTVAVIDEGVDMFHPDLKENVLFEYSYNYHTSSNNPTPVRTVWSSDGGGYYDFPHGTAVAGLIGAKGWNGIGTRGVAPDANIVSLNALEVYANEANTLYMENKIPYPLSDAQLQAHRLYDALVRNIEHIDIYSNSWGGGAISLLDDYPQYLDFDTQLKYGVTNGRGGKGAIYVKAAGNSREALGLDNFESMQTNGYFIVVGASGADGKYSKYSTSGTNILVNAPGGGSSEYFIKPDEHMIVSTDLSGKERGYDAAIVTETMVSHFGVEGNENYDYTQYMNGTSAAAPIVSGVAALLLEANSNLSWRDVQIVLARTATKNDPTDEGWMINGAGLNFNNNYGFGRVDATAAVEMAKTFQTVGDAWGQISLGGENSVQIDSEDGIVNSQIDIEENIKIEHVQIRLSLDKNVTQYVHYQFSGSFPEIDANGEVVATQKGPFELYAGENLFRVTNFDLNQTLSVDLEDSPEREQSISVIGSLEDETKLSRINIEKDGFYYLMVDGNVSSWEVEVDTPLPKSSVENLKISLTSPSGTKSVLVDAPNGLPSSDEYNQTRLSSVQFMDENSQGTWTLEVEDVHGKTISIKNWELKLKGRR